jgi:hypothetical protein
MSVPNSTSRVSYTLTSTTQTLSVPFYFLATTDLQVIKQGTTPVTLAITTNYTVTGAGVEAGGSITLTGVGVSVSDVITIKRNMSLTQPIDLVLNDRLPSTTLERMSDRSTMQIQQLSEVDSRALRFEEGEILDGKLLLSARKGKVLSFNEVTGDLDYLDAANQEEAAASAAVALSASVSASSAVDDLRSSQRGLARWYKNVAAKVASGSRINILCGIDSLTAGAGGYSYIQPFRQMVQEALGDAGIGFQMPTIDNELGATANYSGYTTDTVNTGAIDNTNDGMGIVTLATSTPSIPATFNGGSDATILRETDEIDAYYLKFPTAATSVRMYGFLSGPVFTVNHYAASNTQAKQTLTGFGKSSAWAASFTAFDQQNGPVRYLGFNYRRTCVGGGAHVHFWAKGGSTVQQWSSLNASAIQYLATELGLDLAILNGGMNDRNTRTKAQYKTDLEKIIVNLRVANPNIAILLFFPTIPAGSAGNLALYREAMLELSATYDCAFTDTAWILGDNATAVTRGLILGDSVHPSEMGFRLIANYLFNFIGGGSLSQLKNTQYNTWAPRRDIDASAVQGWKPGTLFPLNQDFVGNLNAKLFNKYYTSAESRNIVNLPDVIIPNTNAGTAFKVFDIGLINGYPEADLSIDILLTRNGTGSRFKSQNYVNIGNTTVLQKATGAVRTETILFYKNLAGDSAAVDVTVTVVNNGTTGRCEVYITPTGGGGAYTTFSGIVTNCRIQFTGNSQVGQSVWLF